MLKIDNNLLAELGLGSLPDVEKNSLLKHIYETLEMRVGMRLADQMSNEQLDEFEQYFEAKDDAGAFKWLETNFPNYKEIVQEEFDKLKVEVKQTAPQILSASQAQAAQNPSGVAPQVPEGQVVGGFQPSAQNPGMGMPMPGAVPPQPPFPPQTPMAAPQPLSPLPTANPWPPQTPSPSPQSPTLPNDMPNPVLPLAAPMQPMPEPPFPPQQPAAGPGPQPPQPPAGQTPPQPPTPFPPYQPPQEPPVNQI
ncbi:MAG TPA: DUF5663 domain-containing protein [Candidatus Saccharimonadales bacterium]|nr:DUF5663 domain-containing protein [Candidatus Saccharimonadales bacterium]